jgi:hypothetical protein
MSQQTFTMEELVEMNSKYPWRKCIRFYKEFNTSKYQDQERIIVNELENLSIPKDIALLITNILDVSKYHLIPLGDCTWEGRIYGAFPSNKTEFSEGENRKYNLLFY